MNRAFVSIGARIALARDRLTAPRFTEKEASSVCLRLSFLLSAGMPLPDALRMVRVQSNARMSPLIAAFEMAVQEGKTVSEGMMLHPRSWPSHAVYAISAGEETGRLAESLKQAAEDIERGRALKAKVVGTLAYPAVIAAAAMGLVIGLTTAVFPKVLPMLTSMDVALPLSTRVVMVVSRALDSWGILAGACIVAAVIAWVALVRRYQRIREIHDRMLFRLPAVGSLLRDYHVARIARMTAALIESGLPLSRALAAVERAESSPSYRSAIATCRHAVDHGGGMSGGLSLSYPLFPEIACQLVRAGEASGTLTQSLSFVARYAEQAIDERSKALSALLEPTIMIALGIIVGFVAVSIIAPIYSLTSHLHA